MLCNLSTTLPVNEPSTRPLLRLQARLEGTSLTVMQWASPSTSKPSRNQPFRCCRTISPRTARQFPQDAQRQWIQRPPNLCKSHESPRSWLPALSTLTSLDDNHSSLLTMTSGGRQPRETDQVSSRPVLMRHRCQTPVGMALVRHTVVFQRHQIRWCCRHATANSHNRLRPRRTTCIYRWRRGRTRLRSLLHHRVKHALLFRLQMHLVGHHLSPLRS